MNFFERYKKIFGTILFLIVVVLLGYLLYTTFFKIADNEPVGEPGTGTSTTGLPSAGQGGKQIIDSGQPGSLGGTDNKDNGSGGQIATPGALVDEIANGGVTKITDVTQTPGFGIAMSGDGRVQYYNPTDGKFYKTDEFGNTSALSDKTFFRVQKITWSPKKSEAVLEYPDGSKTIYNFDRQKQISLPSHWKNFSFSPEGDQLIMKSLGNDPSNKWLAMVNDDGTQVKGISKLGDDASVYPLWSPNRQVAAVYTKSDGLDRQEVFFEGFNNENYKSMMVEGRDFRPMWSPTGDKMLYSVYSTASNLKPSLWIVDAKGDEIGNNRANLQVNTWADKCIFADKETVYCAVPKTLDEGAGMFPEMAKDTPDSIYKIDTVTGTKQVIAIPDKDYNVTELTTSPDGKYLYFNDKKTGIVHRLNLK